MTEALALRATTGTGTVGSVAFGLPAAISSLTAMGMASPGMVAAGAAATATAVVKVTMVKGETPAGDRIWLAAPDGPSHEMVARVLRDLPHLVVESAWGIDDGLWATIEDAPPGESLGRPARAGHAVARAATDAVVNLWRRGPNTPGGVRDRLRAAARRETWVATRIEDMAARLDDDTILAARIGVRRAFRSWRALPAGGALRLTWPLV